MQKKKLITHNGSFHTDDVFACAAFMLLLDRKGDQYEVVRTREEKLIEEGDYVFDVGGIYDEAKNRFDHHQRGGAGKRANGIEYASFGLVWKKFGKELCESNKAADIVEKKLVSPVDAHDNGLDLVENKHEVSPYLIQHAFLATEATWREGLINDEMFQKSVSIAKEILSREIIQAKDLLLAEEAVVENYKSSPDKRVIVLDRNYPYDILGTFPEPLFVIYFKESSNNWHIKAVRENPKIFKNRKNFPSAWAGLRDEELQETTKVADAVFCHRGLFLAVAKSKEGAVKLAQITVEF
ncbi:hypothetical protein A3D42_00265 [Candidatus Nomurabacteria bacterium RIFCSPHIGHO2_02_FULL_41_18]|uniref:Metal-dependent hydrolase n=1 Tax=Candidatus Nomurabacteria bacterium RIFCSPHIGHO2_02_FULL_41_18 TaxID=1801754 RepID=A0A1F6W8C2_9BACT|nr:MAG: hypothetical protein A2737_02455 [Candidatus Nomurabacteria bacterium RIFCSPHIGHO2_01_FULL_41_71]OGI77935.1 MAG: hypothetical protein A3D42_00265 [Candidatus Nomurabacteria bacterium RIFCSPHIGHO2_02_FULL_41_18]OGI89573.1 MAG: hypothetical protein A3B01_00270 [Candidatus Nomurabacteria bacterium RIFCSPLOWO2_01_FULL_41_52b]OGJ00159.1 MAG: hypothetical protein A3I90_00140 [Candidatus Nomurabacteria bacterium RIFCSPLOWO2_02_FULL_41_9]